MGSDIYFGRGRYRPTSPDGLSLLSHELAHTVQQRGVEGSEPAPITPAAETAFEREADTVAGALSEGRRARVRGRLRTGALLRAAWGTCTGKELKVKGHPFRYKPAEYTIAEIYASTHPGDVSIYRRPVSTLPETGKNGAVNALIKQEFFRVTRPSPIKRKQNAGKGDVAGTGNWDDLAGREAELIREGAEEFGQHLLAPDILDVERREVYDVTTESEAPDKVTKIAQSYVGRLNSILTRGGLAWTGLFKVGTSMAPPVPLTIPILPRRIEAACFGPTDFSKWPGVIAYKIVETDKKKKDDQKKKDDKKNQKKNQKKNKPTDSSKKKAKKPVKKPKQPAKGGKPGKLAGKGAAIYQAAVLATALALGAKPSLASAEGAMSPEEAIIMSLLQSGVPVSPELEEIIRKDPELVAKLEQAALTNKSTEEGQKAAQELAKLLGEHAHELTAEQLAELLAVTAPGQAVDPKLAAGREQMKRALAAVQSGQKLRPGKEGASGTGSADAGTAGADAGSTGGTGSGGADAGTRGDGLPPEARRQVEQAPEALRELYRTMSAEAGGAAATPDFVREFLEVAAAANPPLTVEEARRLGRNVGAAGDLPSVLDSLRAAIDERSKPLPELEEAPPLAPDRSDPAAPGEETEEPASESDRDLAIRLLAKVAPSLAGLPKGGWRLVAPALGQDPKPKPGQAVAGLFVFQTPEHGLAAAVVSSVKVVAERGPGSWDVDATVQTLYLGDGRAWSFLTPQRIRTVSKEQGK